MAATTERTFATRSLWGASFLLTKGHRLLGFRLTDAHNGDFVFAWSENIESDLLDYFSGDGQVIARDFAGRYGELRDHLIQQRRAFKSG